MASTWAPIVFSESRARTTSKTSACPFGATVGCGLTATTSGRRRSVARAWATTAWNAGSPGRACAFATKIVSESSCDLKWPAAMIRSARALSPDAVCASLSCFCPAALPATTRIATRATQPSGPRIQSRPLKPPMRAARLFFMGVSPSVGSDTLRASQRRLRGGLRLPGEPRCGQRVSRGCGQPHPAPLALRAAQEGEDGEHAPVVLARGSEAQLPEDARHVLLDRALGHDHTLRDGRIRAALRHQAEHLALARRELAERVGAAAPADELRDDLGIERGAARGDALYRRDELVHVRDAVLEEVAEPLGAVLEQLERVLRLEVRGEDEDAGLRPVRADRLRRQDGPLRTGRRHADVHDGHLRIVGADAQHELV